MVLRASEITNLYKFPLGRSAFALRGVIKRASDAGAHEITELAERMLARTRAAIDMEMRGRAGYSSQYPPEATIKDGVVDRCLGGIAGYFDVHIRVYPEEPRGEAAETLARELLPGGVAAISRLPYAEEHEAVRAMLARARSADLAEHVRTLPELPDMLARLEQRNTEYGEILQKSQDVPTRDEIRQARAECQDGLAEVVGLIIGLYALRAPDKRAERDDLLEPIMMQNEALRALRRRRRLPGDVNPETGEELSDTAADDDAPADGAPDDAPG